MNQSDDRVFIRKFSGIILGLIAFTAVIIALAYSMRSAPDPEDNPSQLRLTEERIAPVAGVRAGSEGQAALATSSCYWAMPANAAAGDVLTAEQKRALRWDNQEDYLARAQLYPTPDAELDAAMQDVWTRFLAR